MLLEKYQLLVAQGEMRDDPAQHYVVERLDSLLRALDVSPKPLSWFNKIRGKSRAERTRGLYVWGPVGRGKTTLMDMFFAATTGPARRRIHFHGFMQDVHRRMHVARKSADANGAILRVAKDLAEDAQLLCLDEMQIADIADAMIVGRLFSAMFDHGTVLVTTSNLPPGELYKNGLNRPLFEPFIRLIEHRLEVVPLTGPLDYRLNRIKAYETFLTPLGPETDAHLQQLWERLTDTKQGELQQIDILGRKIDVPQAAKSCARFSFDDLCAKPLGAADYLALSKEYQAIFIESIPVLGPEQRNEAKRFILLIDTLYDARLKLIASAAAAPDRLYQSGDHSAEFARTVSRLLEMQSASWWGHPIAET